MSTPESLPVSRGRITAVLKKYLRGQNLSMVSLKASRKHVEKALKVSFAGPQREALKELVVQVAKAEGERRTVEEEEEEAAAAAEPATPAAVVKAEPVAKKAGGKSKVGGKAAAKAAPTPAVPLTDAEALKIARTRTMVQLGPDLSKMCEGHKVSVRQLVLRNVWKYITKEGLKGEGKTIRLDDTLRRAGGALISPEDAFIPHSKLMKLIQVQASKYDGEPPAHVVEYVREQGVRTKAVGGKKRVRQQAAVELGLGEGFKVAKKPRRQPVCSMEPELMAIVPKDKAALGVTTRSLVLSWVWEFIRNEDLKTPTGLKPTPELLAVLGDPEENGMLDHRRVMQRVGNFMTPFTGETPAWLESKWQVQMDAFDAQQRELIAKGIDPKQLKGKSKAAPETAGRQSAMHEKLLALDDALTALVGFRLTSRSVLVQKVREYVVQNGLSADPDVVPFKPDAKLKAVTGSGTPMLLKDFSQHLVGRLTPVPTKWQAAVAAGVVNCADFAGTRWEARVRAAFNSAATGTAVGSHGKEDAEDDGDVDLEGSPGAAAVAAEAAGQA